MSACYSAPVATFVENTSDVCEGGESAEQSMVLVIQQDENGDIINTVDGALLTQLTPAAGFSPTTSGASKSNFTELSRDEAKKCAAALANSGVGTQLMSLRASSVDERIQTSKRIESSTPLSATQNCDDGRDDEESSHVCTLCNNSFTSSAQLILHDLSAHPQNALPATKSPRRRSIGDLDHTADSTQLYLCAICQSGYTDVYELQNHVATHSQDVKRRRTRGRPPKHPRKSPPRFEEVSALDTGGINLADEISAAVTKELTGRRGRGRRDDARASGFYYRCNLCSITFTVQGNAMRHLKNQHDKVAPSMSDVTTCRHEDGGATLTGDSDPNQVPLQEGAEEGSADVTGEATGEDVEGSADKDGHPDTLTESSPRTSRGKYKCYVCEKQFATLPECELHRLEHEPTRRLKYPCDTCDKSFPRYQALEKHALIHAGLKEFVCKICGNSFTQKAHLTRHLISVHKTEEKQHVCETCGKRYYVRSDLTRHLRQHLKTLLAYRLDAFKAEVDGAIDEIRNEHGIKVFQCVECQRVFKERHDCKRHLKQHMFSKPFGCHMCSVSYNDKQSLDEHIAMHENEKKIQCAYCDKKFLRMAHLRRHERYHTQEYSFKCDHCGKGFLDETKLRRHTASHVGLREHTCPVCLKGFNDKDYMQKHMRIHSNYRPVVCEQCGKAYRSVPDLKIHLRSHVVGTPFKCDVCGKEYRLQSSLVAHSKSHNPSKLAYCETCGKGFRDKPSLKRHMMIHSTTKTARCEVCDKWYRDRVQLQFHMRIHNRGKTFLCTYCSKAFRDRGKLNRHLLIHTMRTRGAVLDAPPPPTATPSEQARQQRIVCMVDGDKIELVETSGVQDEEMDAVSEAAAAQVDEHGNIMVYWEVGEGMDALEDEDDGDDVRGDVTDAGDVVSNTPVNVIVHEPSDPTTTTIGAMENSVIYTNSEGNIVYVDDHTGTIVYSEGDGQNIVYTVSQGDIVYTDDQQTLAGMVYAHGQQGQGDVVDSLVNVSATAPYHLLRGEDLITRETEMVTPVISQIVYPVHSL